MPIHHKRGLALGVVLILVAAPVLSQEALPVDRTDPKAVAQAYLRACGEGDIEAAIELISTAEKHGPTLRGYFKTYAYEGTEARGGPAAGEQLTSWFVGWACTPWHPFLSYEMRDGIEEGAGEVTVGFRATAQSPLSLKVVRLDDGAWAVDLVESMRASGGEYANSLAWLEGGYTAEYWEWAALWDDANRRSCENLSKLWKAMQAYVRDHGRYPAFDRWVDEIELYILDRQRLRSPNAPESDYGYALNFDAGRFLPDPGDFEAILLFEWPGDERNAAASPDQLAASRELRRDGAVCFVTLAGEVNVLPPDTTFAAYRAALRAERDSTHARRLRVCRERLKNLVRAARKYAREHGGLLPPADTWQDDLAVYLPLVTPGARQGAPPDERFGLGCPAAPDIEFAFAINAKIAGSNALDLLDHEEIVLFFESDLNVPNAAGDPDVDVPAEPRHQEYGWHRSLVGYVSGETGNGPLTPYWPALP